MSIFNNSYSGLITNGLGLPACNLITMNFGIFFGCTISIGPTGPTGPKGGGGGGGSYTTSEFLVPFPNKLRQTTRMVLITVNIGERKWRKTYTVLRERAEIIIKVVNLYNTIRDQMYVGVNSFKRASRRVTATFTRKDK